MSHSARPKVVIVGAGFGGLAAAQRLGGKAVDVTLIDRRNHHVFQQLLYQVATAALSPADIAAPVRAIVARHRNIRVLLDEVTGIDKDSSRVRTAGGAEVPFDWLILSTGAQHSYFGRDDWADHAPGLKSIEDAIAIRRNVLLALERAETETDPKRRAALLTFVIVGAGPTGVEMAGAVAELARRSVSRDFRSITPHCSRVILVEAGPRVLPAFEPEMSAAAHDSLQRLGVELKLNAPVTAMGDGYLQCGNELVLAGTMVWAAGVKASPAADWLGADRDQAGRIFVDDDLTVPGSPHVFAIGDTANAPARGGKALPAIAPVAKQQGRYAADVILGRRSGRFAYHDYGNLATIGRSSAVAELGSLRLTGFTAWLIWSAAHIWFLIGFRSRIAVTLNWLWNYLAYHRGARLITGSIDPVRAAEPIILERKCA